MDYQPNPLISLLPLLLILVPMPFLAYALSKEKGKNIPMWTVLSCIPIVNIFILWYLIGTPNKKLEEKMDRILEALKNRENER
jgi:preprotein translocase subunit YajC